MASSAWERPTPFSSAARNIDSPGFEERPAEARDGRSLMEQCYGSFDDRLQRYEGPPDRTRGGKVTREVAVANDRQAPSAGWITRRHGRTESCGRYGQQARSDGSNTMRGRSHEKRRPPTAARRSAPDQRPDSGSIGKRTFPYAT